MIQGFKNFVNENKGVIYTIIGLVLVDHFVFGGMFRNRLKNIVSNLLDKAEKVAQEGIK